MDGSVLEEKTSFKMLGLTFSSRLDWGSYIVSIAKTVSKKIGALFRSMKFLSPEVALYLYKSTIWPCMEYCCHVWAGAPSSYLELLDKLQKRIRRTVGPSLAASLEPLAHRRGNYVTREEETMLPVLKKCLHLKTPALLHPFPRPKHGIILINLNLYYNIKYIFWPDMFSDISIKDVLFKWRCTILKYILFYLPF